MNTDKVLEGEINIELVSTCVKRLEEFLNKGIKNGSFEMKEIHMMYECYVAITETVKHCDMLQKKIKHLMRQQDLLQQADALQTQQTPQPTQK